MDAETQAISLSNKWYKTDGIKSFGLNKITNIEEMNSYYYTDAYFDSGDSVHICIKEITIKDLP